MKKIMFLSLVVLCGLYATPSFAGACAAKQLTYVGTQKPQHDEFLYENKTEYEASVNGWNASDHYDSGNGNGYECDADACSEGYILTMGAGHVFKGEVVDKQVSYQCHLSKIISDQWEPVDLDNCIYKDTDGQRVLSAGEFVSGRVFTQLSGNCSTSDGTLPNWAVNSVAEKEVKKWKVECRKGTPTKKYCMVETCVDGYTLNADGRCIEDTTEPDNKDCPENYERAAKDYNLKMIGCDGNLCAPIKAGKCYPSEMLRCFEAAANGQPANWNGKTCNCGNVDGVKYSWNTKLTKCEAAVGKSCAELHKGYPERIACCNAGRYTKWEGSKDSGKCICVNPDSKDPNPDSEWFYDTTSQSGICKQKTEPNPNVQPGGKNCVYTFYGEFKCGNGKHIKKNSQIKLSEADLKGLTCEAFQKTYGNDAHGIEELFKNLCLNHPNYVEQQPLDAATKKAINNINSFFDISMSNRNVWRDEGGQFNTTRLASDATAGVVLGTVGGVVSANVIKKKQLEKGFDVLHCTVGGQKMADYGDTFQVSYQR